MVGQETTVDFVSYNPSEFNIWRIKVCFSVELWAGQNDKNDNT